jgi:predicted DNA-binding transcriptional regulator YafY
LYALVEELRAVAPRPRSAAWLAKRFEVSVRTVERDLDALRQSGVPIWSEAGRTGGYALDKDRTLPPLTLTPAEALAVTLALRDNAGSPFAEAARSAAQKVLAALPGDVRRREQALEARLFDTGEPAPAHPFARVIAAGVEHGRVLDLHYTDRHGATTERAVEPLGLLRADGSRWYLVAHCRLRDALRGFALTQITRAEVLAEPVPHRDGTALGAELARLDARAIGRW